MLDKYKGFHTTQPIDALSQITALALLSRWAKLQNYFHPDDLDRLYKIKAKKIAEWLKDEEIFATSIIVREPSTIAGMKVQLENNGADLKWQAIDSYKFYLSETEHKHLELLKDLASKSPKKGIKVDCPPEVVQPQMEAYKIAKREFYSEFNRRKPILDRYEQELKEYDDRKRSAAKKWAKRNKIPIAKSNSGKSLKNDWLKRLTKKGFRYYPIPSYPFSEKLKGPKTPEKTYIVNFVNYVSGSIPEVEEVLSWAKSLVDLPDNYSAIDRDFISSQLEDSLREIVLDRVRKKILEFFKSIIEGTLSDPKEIYNSLTKFEVNYQKAIGLECFTDFRNYWAVPRDLEKWYKWKFSSTANWLVEFQAVSEPSLTFHLPYNRFYDFNIGVDIEELPQVTTEQAKVYQEINEKEKKQYSVEKLVGVLGASEDFPLSFLY